MKTTFAEEYAKAIFDGKIVSGEYVRLAVRRYFADLDNALDKGWHFDRKAAARAINFIERLKHTKGEWAGLRFRLEPWQQFILWNTVHAASAMPTSKLPERMARLHCRLAWDSTCSLPTVSPGPKSIQPQR